MRRIVRDVFFAEDVERAPQQQRWQECAIRDVLLPGLFIFRVYYGLSIELRSGDGLQVYLLG